MPRKFGHVFLEICDFHAPKRTRKVRNNYTPWLTPEIKRLMFERDKLKRAAIIDHSDAHWTEYKIARNNVRSSAKILSIVFVSLFVWLV